MYPVSEAFKQAMRENKPQRVLIEFEGRSFSNEHVGSENPLNFREEFNSATDLTIGQTPSSQISFELLNEDKSLNDFSFGKFTAFLGVQLSVQETSVEGYSLKRTGKTLEVVKDGQKGVYELAPLGVFTAARPTKVDQMWVEVVGNDQMTLFDKNMPSDLGIRYPITAGDLLKKLCDHEHVEAVNYTFTNSTLTLAKEPGSFKSQTMRDVIGKIAEAAGAVARFDRDGKLEMCWFTETDAEFDESDYTEFVPTAYEVKVIDSLKVRNSDSTAEASVGEGSNAYLIQNNPFLRQEDSTREAGATPQAELESVPETEEAASPAQQVLDKLKAAPPFRPNSVELFTDWILQAGDVVTTVNDGERYRTPVYTMNMTWNGMPMVTVENTGNEERAALSELNRRINSAVGNAYQRLKDEDDWQKQFLHVIAEAMVGTTDDPIHAISGITESGFLQMVSRGDIVSAINQTPEEVAIDARKISLNGFTMGTAAQIVTLRAYQMYLNDFYVSFTDAQGDRDYRHAEWLPVEIDGVKYWVLGRKR